MRFVHAVRGFEFTAQVRDQIDEPFGADPPLFQILFERLDGIHTPSILANPADLGEHRFHRMDSYPLAPSGLAMRRTDPAALVRLLRPGGGHPGQSDRPGPQSGRIPIRDGPTLH